MINKLVDQVDYVFAMTKELSNNKLDEDYNIMMSEKAAADCNLLKMSL